MSSEKGQRFAPSYLWLLVGIFVLGAVTAVTATAVLTYFGRTLPGMLSYRFLYLLCALYLWSMLGAGLLRAALSFHVGPSGVQGRTFWGRARYLNWADMSSADLMGPVFARMLRIHPVGGGLPIWMPLFVTHRSELARLTEMYTFQGHPIHARIAPNKGRA